MKPPATKQVTSSLESALVWVGRAMVLALLLYSPWIYGMAEWHQLRVLMYCIIPILLTTGLVVAISKRSNPIRGVLFAAPMLLLALGIAQTLPMPVGLSSFLGGTQEFQTSVVSKASNVSGLDRSEIEKSAQEFENVDGTISIYSSITRSSMVGLACAVGMLLAGAVLFRDKLGCTVLLSTLIALTCLVSVLGIFQSVNWKEWTLLEMPHKANFATFVNRNSAPQFLAVGIGAIIALMADRKRAKDSIRKKSYQRRYPATNTLGKVRQVFEDLVLELDTPMILLLSALALLVIAVVAAGSRGGVVALIFGSVVTTIFFVVSDRRMILVSVFGIAVVSAIAGSMLNLFELDETISERMQDLNPNGRVELWRNALSQTSFWIAGSGLGTFQFAIMPVNPMQSVWPRHAESIYVEAASDLGLVGLAVVLVWLWSIFARVLPSEKNRSYLLWPAAAFTLLTVGMHATVDFGLILPGVFLPFAALIGAFLGNSVDSQSSSPTKRGSGIPALIVFLLLATIVFASGFQSLVGFSQAEKIAKSLNSAKKQAAKSDAKKASIDKDFDAQELDLSHPEVVLQLARLRLFELELQLQGLEQWPKNVTLQQRKQLSSPEFVSSVIRSSRNDEPWSSLRQFFAAQPSIQQQLGVLNKSFQFHSRHCSYDWRSAWGLFQTDVNRSSSQSVYIWAKLDSLGSSVFNVKQVAATCLLIAGESRTGIQAWQETILSKPKAVSELGSLVGTLVSEDQVSAIVPSHPLAIARLAKSMQQTRPESALSLLASVDLVQLKNSCKVVDEWELAAWVAQQVGENELLLDCLNTIAAIKPFDVSIRVRIAKFHEQDENLQEAIRILEQASRRTTLPSDVQNYLIDLQKRSQGIRTPPR